MSTRVSMPSHPSLITVSSHSTSLPISAVMCPSESFGRVYTSTTSTSSKPSSIGSSSSTGVFSQRESQPQASYTLQDTLQNNIINAINDSIRSQLSSVVTKSLSEFRRENTYVWKKAETESSFR